MLVETIKDYTDKETKAVFKTTDNCIIRRVSDARGEELIAAGVVAEVKLEDEVKSKVETKPKSKPKKKDEVENTEDEAVEETEESAEGTQSE